MAALEANQLSFNHHGNEEHGHGNQTKHNGDSYKEQDHYYQSEDYIISSLSNKTVYSKTDKIFETNKQPYISSKRKLNKK